MPADYDFSLDQFSPVGTDWSPAFEAMLAACVKGTGTSVRAARCVIPRGDYRLSRDLRISYPVVLDGLSGGSGFGGARLSLDPFCSIIPHDILNSPNGGDGSGSVFRNLDIYSCPYGSGSWQALPTWHPSVSVGAGDVCIPSIAGGDLQYHYRALKGGTSGPSEPHWWNTQTPDESVPWAPQMPARYGTVVRATGRFDIFFMAVAPSLYIPGTVSTGAAEPAWNFTPGALTSDANGLVWRAIDASPYMLFDGDIVWSCRVAAGIRALAPVHIENVWVHGSINAAVHLQADLSYAPGSNESFSTIDGLTAHQCGGGVLTRGGDGNWSKYRDVLVSGSFTDTREFGILDRSFLGCAGSDCQAQSVRGTPFGVYSINAAGAKTYQNASLGSMRNLYVESDCGPQQVIATYYRLDGGNPGSGYTPDSTFVGIVPPNQLIGAQLSTKSNGHALQMTLVGGDGFLNARADDDGYWTNIAYQNGTLYAIHAGAFRALGITGTQAPEGRGMVKVLSPALFLANGLAIFTQDGWTSAHDTVRGGERLVGDRIFDVVDKRCVAHGWIGPPWLPNHGYGAGTPRPSKTASPPSIVSPGNGSTYACVLNGSSGPAQPAWSKTPGVITVDGSTAWNCLGPEPTLVTI